MAKWISSAGGPLILVPGNAVRSWQGINGSSFPSVASDYERACSVREYVEVMPLSGEDTIIFGEEPLQTTWLPRHENFGGVFIRWICAENEEAIIDSLDNLKLNAQENTGLNFTVRSDVPMRLFDAAFSGSAALASDEGLVIQIAPGAYKLTTIECSPTPKTKFLAHRIIPA